MRRADAFPLGAAVTIDQLHADPHDLLARLRDREPDSRLTVHGGWLITRYDLALQAIRDPTTFTVDDPRFSTSRVIGPSMLSLDGEEHARHRAPFAGPFRPLAVRERFAAELQDDCERLLDAIAPDRSAELRRSFAGPLAATTITRALGLAREEVATVLGWYDAIVAAVTEVTEG